MYMFRLVEFSDRDGMEYALRELDDTKLDGRRIRLVEERRSPSRSRSRNIRHRDDRSSESDRSRSRSVDNVRSQEKLRRHRSMTPDEKCKSMSTDRSRISGRLR